MTEQEQTGKPKLIKFGPALLADLYEIAKAEGRTFSDLIRECARQYVNKFRREKGD